MRAGQRAFAATVARHLGKFLLPPLAGCLLLAGCVTGAQTAAGKVAEMALSAVGMRLPDSSGTRTVELQISAGEDLNAGSDGIALSTVVRLYELRDRTSFLAAPYDAFSAPAREKQAFGDDLLGARELMLMPGQKLDLREKLASGTNYLGVVSLFRTPEPRRWRLVFATADAASDPIVIGLHACAMSAGGSMSDAATPTPDATLAAPGCR